MSNFKIQGIKKSEQSHRVIKPTQTGFSSPATHYSEPRIDLNEVLVEHPISTFYIRVVDDSFIEFNINIDDVLIVDKSRNPLKNQLAIISVDGDFKIIKIDGISEREFNLWGVITYIIKSVL